MVDTPAVSSAAVQPFTISGWAVDTAAGSGTGVDIVHAWIWETACVGEEADFLGYATYGAAHSTPVSQYGSQARRLTTAGAR